MNVVKCIVPNCKEEFRTSESVSPGARFICKNHPREVQVRANGRVFDEKKDTQDMSIRFQNKQFDHSLGRSLKGAVDIVGFQIEEGGKSDVNEGVNAL